MASVRAYILVRRDSLFCVLSNKFCSTQYAAAIESLFSGKRHIVKNFIPISLFFDIFNCKVFKVSKSMA